MSETDNESIEHILSIRWRFKTTINVTKEREADRIAAINAKLEASR